MKEVSKKTIIMSVILEHITTILVMFISYRYFISILGLKNIGIWALITAIFSLSSIGNSGFASSAVKYVAKYLAYNDINKIIQVIATTFITVLATSIIFLSIIIWFLVFLREKLFTIEEYLIIKDILFIGGLSFLISILSRVFLSSLDGLKLIHIRSMIGFLSKIIYIISIYFLITKFKFKGLIYAEIVQYTFTFIIAGLYLYFKLKPRISALLKIDKNVFVEMVNYGSIFQLTSIFQMLMDPLSKFFLRKFGGFESIAIYDISYKFFFQARQLIVAFVTTLVPYVSVMKENKEDNLAPLFLKIYNINLILSALMLLFVFAFLPILFNILNLTFNINILLFSIFISLTLFFNLIGVPAYIFNLGIGRLYSNFIFTLIMAILNLVLCLILGPMFKAEGILSASLLAQLIALFILLRSFSKNLNINFIHLLNKKIILLLVFFLLSLSFIFINNAFNKSSNVLLPLYNIMLLFPFFYYLYTINNEFIKFIKLKINFMIGQIKT